MERPITTTLFRNARVFDGQGFLGGPHDVLVRSGLVAEVVPSSAAVTVDGSPRVEVVECAGRTLLPGFIDAHVHLMMSQTSLSDIFDKAFSQPFYESVGFARAVLRSGVTTVRDAGFADAGMRDAIDQGIIDGPRMKVALSIVSMTGGHGDLWLRSGVDAEQFVETPGRPRGIADGSDELLKVTRRLFRAGADHIKICTSGGVLSMNDEPEHPHYSVGEIRTVVEEAADHGSYVMSHAIGASGARRAVRAGVRSIEHGVFLDDECLALMVEGGTYLVPTLTAPLQVIRGTEAGVRVPPKVLEKAKRVAEAHAGSFSRAVDAGVRIAMGSDAGVGPHGVGLEELVLMAEGGLSLEGTLAAATSVAADLMQESERLGAIAVGRVADLVLLDVVLESTAQLRGIGERVVGVWQGGRPVL